MFTIPLQCQLYIVHGMKWLTCWRTKVKKDRLIYWSRKDTVSLTEMRCQMMAGRAAKSPPDWLLYLPPDPSLPWAVAGEEQGKIYTWLGVRTGKHAGIKAPGVWPGHSGPLPSTCHRAGRSLSPWASQGGRKTSKTSLCSQPKVALWQVTPVHPEMLPFPFPICSLL